MQEYILAINPVSLYAFRKVERLLHKLCAHNVKNGFNYIISFLGKIISFFVDFLLFLGLEQP